jgi:hypothetical protein
MGEVVSYTAEGIIALIADAITEAGFMTEAELNAAVADFVTQATVDGTVATAVAALVNSAPGTLDQLNELATAIGNDPNFATTLATSLAGKASLVGGKVPVGEIPLITSAMITDGTIAVGDLAFDPATQAELDAVRNGSMQVVVHGAVAGTARPAGGASIVVHWIGSVAPTNAIDNDVWTDNT